MIHWYTASITYVIPSQTVRKLVLQDREREIQESYLVDPKFTQQGLSRVRNVDPHTPKSSIVFWALAGLKVR